MSNTPKNITTLRMSLSSVFNSPGITPVLRNGELVGLILSTADEFSESTQLLQNSPEEVISQVLSFFNDQVEESVEKGIHPLKNGGKLTGIRIVSGDLDEKSASRLEQILKFNPKAAVGELLDHATNP